jgi:hypothetical protein
MKLLLVGTGRRSLFRTEGDEYPCFSLINQNVFVLAGRDVFFRRKISRRFEDEKTGIAGADRGRLSRPRALRIAVDIGSIGNLESDLYVALLFRSTFDRIPDKICSVFRVAPPCAGGGSKDEK